MEADFKKGQKVEVSSDAEGYEGSWFVASIVGTPTKKTKKKYIVEYESLLDETETKPLREDIDLSHIRPIQPVEITSTRFKRNQEVDVFFNDGWWKGVVTKVLSGSRYSVYFKATNEELNYQQSDLRLHLEWIDGRWVHDLSQNQEIDTDVDTCTKSNTTKEKMEQTTTKRNTESSRHCKKLKKENAATSSSVLRVQPDKAMDTNTNLSKKMSSYPVLRFFRKKKGSASDGNASERPDQQQCRTSCEAGSCCQVRASPGEKQGRRKRSKEQYCLVTCDNDTSRNSTGECLSPVNQRQHKRISEGQGKTKDRNIEDQYCEAINKEENEIVTQALVVSHSCDEVMLENGSLSLVVYGEKTMPTNPSPLGRSTDHAAPSFHQDKIVQSAPLSIKIPDDRLCHEMVSPGKSHCQKHQGGLPCFNGDGLSTTHDTLDSMKDEQVGQVVIPGSFVQLYKGLVARFGEILPPKLSKVKKRACEVTLLELLDVVSSILATLPVEITSEKINSWEEIAEDCASIGLRMDWFMERMNEYRNWLVKCSSENLEDLEMEITETDVVLVEKRRETKILEEKLVALKARLAKAREDRCSLATFL